ncbi:hypothetical protein PV379_05040 [Streptomyces caniscabiei]|uniref:hypothetical protein n=1 Tax=Streptomyces caniscabiei TaxID=2746961 RepID=UPI0029B23E54|nr:hypothetical protein [Streptomyces caniscabiei]MDX2776696.1 hypothetical protein [Streptomyces caniscabiei]
MTIIVVLLAIRAVRKGWKPIPFAVLFTLLIGLLGLSNLVLEAITDNAAKVNADEFYGITATGLGLALPAGGITWLLRKTRAPFIFMFVVTLMLLRVDVILVEAALGPFSDKVNEFWNWLYPEMKKWFESI